MIPRSLIVTGVLTAILLAPLGYQSYQFVHQAQRSTTINEVVNQEIDNLPDVELVSVDSYDEDGTLEIEITIRTLRNLDHEDSVALRAAIDVQLQQPVELSINQIFAARLDPRVPPTLTPTTLITLSATPTATRTSTPISTSTSTHTPTATPTATPATALLSNTFNQSSISLRQSPDGPKIGFIERDSLLTVLYGYEIVDGWVWIEVQDSTGRIGWIPQFYTELVTIEPNSTLDP